MAFGSHIKTEHVGAKKGSGAFYGRKQDAKEYSRARRRADSKAVIQAAIESDTCCDECGIEGPVETCSCGKQLCDLCLDLHSDDHYWEEQEHEALRL